MTVHGKVFRQSERLPATQIPEHLVLMNIFVAEAPVDRFGAAATKGEEGDEHT